MQCGQSLQLLNVKLLVLHVTSRLKKLKGHLVAKIIQRECQTNE